MSSPPLAQLAAFCQAQLYATAMGLEGVSRGVFAVFDEVVLPELATRFVRPCIGAGDQRIGWNSAFSIPLAHNAGARFINLPRVPVSEPLKQAEPLIQTWQATGAEAELRAVLRGVLQRGPPWIKRCSHSQTQ